MKKPLTLTNNELDLFWLYLIISVMKATYWLDEVALSVEPQPRVWEIGSSVSGRVRLKNWYLSLPSLALCIIRVWQWLVSSVSCQDNVTGILGHDAGGLISQWGSTIRSPWVHTVASRYPSWYGLRCCQDRSTNRRVCRIVRYKGLRICCSLQHVPIKEVD